MLDARVCVCVKQENLSTFPHPRFGAIIIPAVREVEVKVELALLSELANQVFFNWKLFSANKWLSSEE